MNLFLPFSHRLLTPSLIVATENHYISKASSSSFPAKTQQPRIATKSVAVNASNSTSPNNPGLLDSREDESVNFFSPDLVSPSPELCALVSKLFSIEPCNEFKSSLSELEVSSV